MKKFQKKKNQQSPLKNQQIYNKLLGGCPMESEMFKRKISKNLS